MRYLRQLCIILAISCAGELLRFLLPFPIPAGIYGFVLLFVMLCTGAVRLDQVEGAADLLVEIMQLILLPACVSIMDYWSSMADIIPAMFVICLVSTAAVLGTAGRVSDFIIDRRGGSEND
ncbi:MAG: CidA/LrgA family protein [Candidatus Heteroscillospira sp.]|jgi:holin-like protein